MIQLSFHSTLTVGQTDHRWMPHLPPIESTRWPYSTLKARGTDRIPPSRAASQTPSGLQPPAQALQQFPLPIRPEPVLARTPPVYHSVLWFVSKMLRHELRVLPYSAGEVFKQQPTLAVSGRSASSHIPPPAPPPKKRHVYFGLFLERY